MAGPKVQDLVDEEMWICLSYPFKHESTLHCAERKPKLFGNWIMQHWKLFICFVVQCIVCIYEYKSFEMIHFFKVQYWEIERTRQMTDQEDNINLSELVFDDKNQERKMWACLGQTCSRSLIVFLSKLFVILLTIFGCLWRIHLSKFVTKQLFE